MQIWTKLSSSRKLFIFLLLLLLLLSGVAELLSLGALLPFLAVLSDSNLICQNPKFSPIISLLDCSNQQSLIFTLTFAFVFLAVTSSIIRLVNLRFTGWLSASIGADISSDCYKKYLYQNYFIHKQSNSNKAMIAITSYVSSTTSALNSTLNLCASVIVGVGLITALLFVDSTIAISLTVLFVAAYSILALISRKELYANGKFVKDLSSYQLKFIRESFGSIRDIIIDNNFNYFIQKYSDSDYLLKRKNAKNGYLSLFPRYAMEAVGLVCISVLGAYLTINNFSDRPVLPILGTVALGAQRLLPVSQQIYSSWASLKGTKPSIEEVVAMLSLPLFIPNPKTSIKLKEKIRFTDLSFKYNNSDQFAINSINLTIRKGERIGIMGASGSGKSTFLDLFLGLLKGVEGSFEVDNLNLYEEENIDRLSSWRKNISHVPQKVFLLDASFSENIAFGIPLEQINHKLLEFAAKQANIYDFITSTKHGFSSSVGEAGAKLSGGQQQRIGIARALYKNSDIIVLDEATSALDTQTESSIMSTINNLSLDITVIIVAHRLSTLMSCSKVLKLQDGRIVASGPPESILNN